MTVVEKTALPKEKDLARLLQMGVVVEEYAEEKSARLLGESVEDDEVRAELQDPLNESGEHRDILAELVQEVGADIDKERVERLVREAVEAEVDEPKDGEKALRQQLETERLAYSFYDNLIEACRASKWADEYEDILSVLSDIRRDELEDANEIEKKLAEQK